MTGVLQTYFISLKHARQKALAVLLDPDKVSMEAVPGTVAMLEAAGADILLVGGSLVQNTWIHELIPLIKAYTTLPVILFPGSLYQISPAADGILFLSLISGRNPDFLIGRHVEAAPMIRAAGLEVLPTGYILVDAGSPTTVNYISHTLPVPHNKPEVAACTAMAGEMLGLRLIYLDGGSGAQRTVSPEMIRIVSAQLQVPLIAGGGIRSAADARRIWEAGADVIVIGTALETGNHPELLTDIAVIKNQLNLEVAG
ncbi:MAG: geranylgeranylglyceryl/heptaprenylglyceryl phosphate synthase [Bacteroidia bacterium]|nr:geranylgeranylglyceryl/heptaprenylglyceryl phosphate synthase [Bacteroidia bacterium]